MTDANRRYSRLEREDLVSIPSNGDSPSARSQAVEEGLIAETDTLPQPAGFGEEASRSAQSFAEIGTYEVPANSIAYLVEASLSLESNGEALVNAGGVQFGPYTGSLDIQIPFGEVALSEHEKVVVKHQSTDGNTTTTKAQVVAAEV